MVYAPGMSDTSPSDPPRPVERVSTAIRTVPNAVTLARLLLMPLCAYLLATGRFGWGIALTAVVGSTDWVDGWLARRTGQVSRLGQLLDPLADRLLFVSVAIALVSQDVVEATSADGISFREVGPVELKGVARPVVLHRAERTG